MKLTRKPVGLFGHLKITFFLNTDLCKSDLLNTGNKPDSLKLEITYVKVDLLSTGNKPDSWTLEMNQILKHCLLISQKFIFHKYTVSFITPKAQAYNLLIS